MENLERQIARSCDLDESRKDALLEEARRCGWVEATEDFRDWIYAHLSF